jgi:hypothetical protein
VASRAEARTVPGLGAAFRTAAGDLYYNSWRLLPANVLWSIVLLGIVALAIVVPPLLLLAPVLALPLAGLFRMTTRIARGEAVAFSDAIDAWRRDVLATLGLGSALLGATIVLASNVVTGLVSASVVGWGLATLAAWGLVAAWLYAWAAWPLLVDPARSDRPVRERLRLAALLVIAHPGRIGALGLALAAFLIASTVAIVALITVSVAVAAMVAARYVLPAADRLEARLMATGPERDADRDPEGMAAPT